MANGDPVNPKKSVPEQHAPDADSVDAGRGANDEENRPLTAHDEEDEGSFRRGDQDWDDSDEGDIDEPLEGEEAPEAAAEGSKARTAVGQGASSEAGSPRGGPSPSRPIPPPREQEEDRRPRARMERRPTPNSVQELFEKEIPYRASFADQKLRQHLTGSVLVKVVSYPERRAERSTSDSRSATDRRGAEQRYLFDWTGDAAKCAASEAVSADCVISVTETNLMRIVQGDLNPQISMLSEKVRVEGQASLAIYFFNLVAPSNGSFV